MYSKKKNTFLHPTSFSLQIKKEQFFQKETIVFSPSTPKVISLF